MFTQNHSISLFDASGPMLPRLYGYVIRTDNELCVIAIEDGTVTARVEIPLDALRALLKEK